MHPEDYNKGITSTNTTGSPNKRPLLLHSHRLHFAGLHHLLQSALQAPNHATLLQTNSTGSSHPNQFQQQTLILGRGPENPVAGSRNLHDLHCNSLHFPRIHSRESQVQNSSRLVPGYADCNVQCRRSCGQVSNCNLCCGEYWKGYMGLHCQACVLSPLHSVPPWPQMAEN